MTAALKRQVEPEPILSSTFSPKMLHLASHVDAPDRLCIQFTSGTTSRPKGEVISACRQLLASFKVPWEVYVVEDFPRAALDKIAKSKLKERLKKLDPVQN